MSEAINLPLLLVELDLGPGFAAGLAATIDALLQPPSASDVERMRQLLRDLEAIRNGDGPSSAQLATAPLLSDWCLALAPDGLRLVGEVTGHPLLGTRTRVRTSPVYAVGPEFSFARTLSRFYRLGPMNSAPMAKTPIKRLH